MLCYIIYHIIYYLYHHILYYIISYIISYIILYHILYYIISYHFILCHILYHISLYHILVYIISYIILHYIILYYIIYYIIYVILYYIIYIISYIILYYKLLHILFILHIYVIYILYTYEKGKAVWLQALTCPDGSRKLYIIYTMRYHTPGHELLKQKGKDRRRTGHEGPERRSIGIAPFCLWPQPSMRVRGQRQAPAAFPLGKRYGTQCAGSRVDPTARMHFRLLEFYLRTIQPVARRFTDWAIPACKYHSLNISLQLGRCA